MSKASKGQCSSISKPSKFPRPVQELVRKANELGVRPSELQGIFLSYPDPPLGYVLAEGCADRWIGPEMTDRKWIITPAWDADTERHAIEVWTPKYQDFTPKQARQFAAALVEMAEIVDGIAGGTGGSSTDG